MITTFEKAKVDDKVWSFKEGWGTIVEIDHDNYFPLLVSYVSNTLFPVRYTLEGKYFPTDISPTIYWNEVEFTAPLDELGSRLGAETRKNELLEKALASCENALLYKDGLLDKAYRKIGELAVSVE